ncbi:unnamed protein product [Rotaria sp. Silwood1]|nr:unnamed protein product [Rotaria sp. Silwood1]CAF1636485.1 unnamed protein product [Rotaria sp. Silwood1]CAF4964467.1 unnamed protein product [Rotaria sp. Silwood1]
MSYAAVYALAILADNTSPDVTTMSKILGSVGIVCDNTKAQKVIDTSGGAAVGSTVSAGKVPAEEEEDMGYDLFD